MLADAADDVAVVVRPALHVDEHLATIIPQCQLRPLGTIDLGDVFRVQGENRECVGRESFEKSRCHQPQLRKGRACNDRIECRLAHPIDHRFEGHGLEDLDPERVQIGEVTVVGVFEMHRDGPWRKRPPAIAQQRYAAKLRADRLHRMQHGMYRAPAEFTVPNIDHAEFFHGSVGGSLPLGVVRVEQAWMKRGLANFVGKRVADGDPSRAIAGILMIIVAVD